MSDKLYNIPKTKIFAIIVEKNVVFYRETEKYIENFGKKRHIFKEHPNN